jgi:transcriptional regulator with XRE-family HTH domain
MLDDALYFLRLEAELTVLQVAHELKVSTVVVYQWERGASRPRYTHLAALMRLYRATPAARDDVAHLAAFGERR